MSLLTLNGSATPLEKGSSTIRSYKPSSQHYYQSMEPYVTAAFSKAVTSALQQPVPVALESSISRRRATLVSRRERNRASAERSRMRKREESRRANTSLSTLTEQNESLRKHVDDLMRNIHVLRKVADEISENVGESVSQNTTSTGGEVSFSELSSTDDLPRYFSGELLVFGQRSNPEVVAKVSQRELVGEIDHALGAGWLHATDSHIDVGLTRAIRNGGVPNLACQSYANPE